MSQLLRKDSGKPHLARWRVEVLLEGASESEQNQVVQDIEQLLAQRNLNSSSIRVSAAGDDESADRIVAAARVSGEARLVKWTQDGTLLPVSAVEEAWGIKRQSVDAARARNEIFSVYVRGQHWYPAEALKFDRASLARVMNALGEQAPTAKLLFLLRKHGALGGKTPAEAAQAGMLTDVERVAEADSMG